VDLEKEKEKSAKIDGGNKYCFLVHPKEICLILQA